MGYNEQYANYSDALTKPHGVVGVAVMIDVRKDLLFILINVVFNV
jgi:hypothetical protein